MLLNEPVIISPVEAISGAYNVSCYVRPADEPGKDGFGQVFFEPYAQDGMVEERIQITLNRSAYENYEFYKWQVWKQVGQHAMGNGA